MVTIDRTQASDRSSNGLPCIETKFVDYSQQQVFQCNAILFADPNGEGFTVISKNLPGVVSEGDTEAEAIENIKDAFAESVLSYMELGEDIPWGDASDVMSDESPKRELHLLVKIDA